MMKPVIYLLSALSLAGTSVALAAEKPQAPDAGIFDQFINKRGCVSMKAITDAGGTIMPLKDGTFRFLQGVFTAIPPVSHELPPGDKAVLAIGPHAETMGILVDGEQTCARFILPGFLIEMVAAIESGDKAPPDKSGDAL